METIDRLADAQLNTTHLGAGRGASQAGLEVSLSECPSQLLEEVEKRGFASASEKRQDICATSSGEKAREPFIFGRIESVWFVTKFLDVLGSVLCCQDVARRVGKGEIPYIRIGQTRCRASL